MTDPITFNAYLGWADVTDPANIPANVRIIGAADLVRYEKFGQDGTARLNMLTVFMDAAPTTYAAKSVETSKANVTDLTAHTGNTANPHAVTKAQVGLGNVDNTADANKPISAAVQAVLDKLPKGTIYRTDVGTPSGDVVNAIVNNIASFTFKAGRNYRIVWDTSYLQSAAGDLFFWDIGLAALTDTAADLANITSLGGRTKGVGSSGTNVTQHTGPITAYYKPATDTTMQVKFRIQRALGAGTVRVQGQTAENAAYLIYDDGAQL